MTPWPLVWTGTRYAWIRLSSLRSRSRARWRRLTAPGSSTATSSPGTWCSPPPGRSSWISAWPSWRKGRGWLRARPADTMTAEGQLVGTLPYMSPEQVEGKRADARSDIFSFGAVLHEMLTQEQAFKGSQAHLIAAILSSHPPPPSQIRARVPAGARSSRGALPGQGPEERWQNAQDLLLELKWAISRAPAAESRGKRSLRGMAWAAGTALVGALGVAALLRLTGEDPLPNASSRQVTLAPGWESAPALSPDGGLIAYSSDESGNADIWIVDVRGGNAIRLTDDPASDTDPAWFPDGSALAFTSDRGGSTCDLESPAGSGEPPRCWYRMPTDAALSPDGSQIAFAQPVATQATASGSLPWPTPPEQES